MTQDAAGDYVVYDDRDNFLALIEKAIPSADLPAFLSKKKGAITVGDVSEVCEKKPVQYGITVSGVQKSALTQAAVGKALSTAINTELAKAKATLKLPTCDSSTDSFKFPSSWPPTKDQVKTAAKSLICMIDTDATTFEENADGSITVSGNLNAGAGQNAQALQAAMVAAVADGSIKIGAGTVGKDVTGYTKCTAAQCTAAGKYAEQTCGAGVCSSSGGGGGGGSSSSKNVGNDVGIAVGAICVVGIGAALFMKSKKRRSEKDELLGNQHYVAHTDGDGH
jgi:hypothetical protein